MQKKIYLILPVLILVSLLSFAAICNSGQATNNGEISNQDEQNKELDEADKNSDNAGIKDEEDNKDSEPDSGKSPENTTSDDADKKDEPEPEDSKSEEENKTPIVSGIYLDGLDPIDYYFFTGDTYTARAEAIDPEGGSLSFSWSGDGTIAGYDINPMSWTAPSSEGVYNLTVEVTDNKGASSTFTSDIYVNAKSAADQQEPNNPPILGEILVCEDGTLIPVASDDFWDDIYYNLHIDAVDPDGDNLSYTWTVTVGKMSNPNSNPARWDVPKIEWQGNQYESVTITVTVDDGKGGTVTISRTIDLYVV
jgi:hypothetical protein